MEAKRYYWGFTPSLWDEDFTITITNDGGGNSGSASILTSETDGWYHGTLADTGGDPAGTFTGFATKLKTILDAATAATWTVTWSNATVAYTLSNDQGGNIDLTLSTWAQRILGMGSDPTPATSLTSTVTPWFLNIPNVGCVARLDEGEGEAFEESVTDGGRGLMVGPSRVAMEYSWVQQHETHAATRTYQAAGSAPFTWERAFTTCRGFAPFLLVDSESGSISYGSDVVGRFQLTAQGARFRPRRVDGRTNSFWELPFRTRCLERVKA